MKMQAISTTGAIEVAAAADVEAALRKARLMAGAANGFQGMHVYVEKVPRGTIGGPPDNGLEWFFDDGQLKARAYTCCMVQAKVHDFEELVTDIYYNGDVTGAGYEDGFVVMLVGETY